MLRQGPEFPAQVTSVEDLIQQLNAELINDRLHALNESLRAAFADTDKDHPSQIVFDALKYQFMQIISNIHAGTTEQDITRWFDDLHDEFVTKYLAYHIAFSLVEINKNELLKKKLIKLAGIKSLDELTSEKLFASLSDYKRELFNKIVAVYLLLAQQCLALQQSLVSDNEFNDQMSEIVETFHRNVRGITNKIATYKSSQIRVGIYTPTEFDLLDDRLEKLDVELNANLYFEQVRSEVFADVNSLHLAVNRLQQSQSNLYRRAETLRNMFAGILKLSAAPDVSTEEIGKHIERYDALTKQLQDDVAEQQKQFSNAKEELLKQGKAAFKSFQELDVNDTELPEVNQQSINQQQLIIDIDSMIAKLQDMQKDDAEFKEKVLAQTSENHRLFKNIGSVISQRLMKAREAYLACVPALNDAAGALSEACMGQTWTIYKNPLWVSASTCAVAQLSSENYSQHHLTLVNNTRTLTSLVEGSAANVTARLDHRFIESTTEELLRIHREYDAAIDGLQTLRRAAVQKINRHLMDKARAELPAMKQEAIQKYELSLNLLKDLKAVGTEELNIPSSDALRQKYKVPEKPKKRRASFSSALVKAGMDVQPKAQRDAIVAHLEAKEKPGFFKRHPWVKAALIGVGVGLLIAGLVIGVAAITVATMGAGAPPAIAGVVAVGAIVGAKLGLVAGSAAATGVGFAVVVGGAGAAGALAGCATKAVIDRCQKPVELQNVVAAPVANPVDPEQANNAPDVIPAKQLQNSLSPAPVVIPIHRKKGVERTVSSSMPDIKYSRASNVSKLGFFAFNALPIEEQSLIEKFEVALAKEIFQILWGHNQSIATKLQNGVTNKNSARSVIEKNLESADTRDRVIKGIRNTIVSSSEFTEAFGKLDAFQGKTMEDLDAYLHSAYKAQQSLAI